MEDLMIKAADFLSSADIYLLAIAGVLTALLPIIRKTKTKTDDKIADSILAGIPKIRSFFTKKSGK